MSDSVGFGFVVRGEGPCYVQTVDPSGPAASAGLKVCLLCCCVLICANPPAKEAGELLTQALVFVYTSYGVLFCTRITAPQLGILFSAHGRNRRNFLCEY